MKEVKIMKNPKTMKKIIIGLVVVMAIGTVAGALMV